MPDDGEDVIAAAIPFVRHFAQRLGLARRSGGRLVLTDWSQEALSDPEQLWRSAA